MNAVKQFEETINELDNGFKNNVRDNKLDISIIENLAINSMDSCKQIINNHIENLIFQEINEKELIVKKNKNGNN